MGAIYCLLSAAAFGAMAIFGKLAYDEGVTVGDLLLVRFAVAAVVMLGLVWWRGGFGPLPRRTAVAAFAMGAVGYAAQSASYFAALDRIDASLLSLMLYTFPGMVAVAAIVLGRERADRRRLGALGLASGGLVLVLASAKAGSLDPVGTALALTAAVIYTTYILVSEGIAGRLRPSLLSALVCTGAAVSLTLGSAAIGDLHPGDVTAEGWGWLAGIAVVSTVAAVSLFFAGLKRVGPTTASILSTVEPVVTVVLAFLVFGELLGMLQLVGGALVIAAVLVLGSYRPREAIGGAAA
jgi:drug/metabolite transporter (DMT)-like permease